MKRRYEIMGHLWGVLETIDVVDVRDLSVGGMQIEAPFPLTVGTEHLIDIQEPLRLRVRAQVRHADAPADVSDTRYAIGFGFTQPDDARDADIDALVADADRNA